MSRYFDILSRLKADLETVADHPPVELRHEIAQLEPELDPLPAIFLAPSKRWRQFATGSFGKRVVYDYPVDVVMVHPSGRAVKDELEQYLALEEAVNAKIFRLLDGVPLVYDMRFGVELDASLAASNLRVRAWNPVYRSEEANE